ncbi:MAG: hypothetical protein IKB50_03190 [Clostridia bacterium]|nr:hypothetical protein [Clostridia bacterium]
MELIKKALKWINGFNKKQWLFVSIFTTTSGVWFSLVLNFWGNSLNLTRINSDGSREFTLLGAALTLATIIWSMLSYASQRYCEYHASNLKIDEETVNQTETMYETVGSGVANVFEDVVSNKISYIDNLENGVEKIPKQIFTKPCNELKRITEEICKNLSKLLSYKEYNIKERDISVNLFYKFQYQCDQWHRIDSSRNETGMTINELFSDGTTIHECLNSPTKFVYYHSKEDAKNANHYIPVHLDEYDNKKKLKGSIVCYEVVVYKGDLEYIDCMISISTYRKKFSNKEDGDIIAYNIKNNILSEYIPLIKSALCDLYVYRMRK